MRWANAAVVLVLLFTVAEISGTKTEAVGLAAAFGDSVLDNSNSAIERIFSGVKTAVDGLESLLLAASQLLPHCQSLFPNADMDTTLSIPLAGSVQLRASGGLPSCHLLTGLLSMVNAPDCKLGFVQQKLQGPVELAALVLQNAQTHIEQCAIDFASNPPVDISLEFPPSPSPPALRLTALDSITLCSLVAAFRQVMQRL
eukprot:gnl/Hemi2/8875_TR3064_c0_g1_i1.p2 gnl/Hemi2/8875_TR3064_c0_g1~~gnl/Hemi2/8875_TR3064_c0_g1_i1.p2  ORF type:complete len:200 (-),score=47.97 gnl/Hemi2/8875_TR3064_c0_g1_i1:76-675(-)